MAIEAFSTGSISGIEKVGREKWAEEFKTAKETAKRAGELVLKIRASNLESKEVVLENGKIVTQTNADIEAGEQIIKELSKSFPKHVFLSQDQMSKAGSWFSQEYVWMINPIDNTSEFEKGNDDFHIQIGLLHNNEAVLGISYYPAKKMFIYAIQGQGAWKETPESVKKLVANPCSKNILLKSSDHALIEPLLDKTYEVTGEPLSSTTRLLHMIEGNASLYVSLGASPLGKNKKGAVWNYGANAVIAKEVGLFLVTLRGNPLNLREPSALLTEGVILGTDFDAVTKLTKHFQNHW